MNKKTALIFGITGQDGSYLAELLLKKKYKVFGVIRRSSAPNTQRIDHIINLSPEKKNYQKVSLVYGDLMDTLSIYNLINNIKPTEIYNLAAMSHVKVSFDIPEYTYNVVGIGPLRILEAIRNLNIKCKYLQASSSEMYGNINSNIKDEKTKFQPESPYASAKVLAYWTTVNYRNNYNIFASNSIMFNHESPRRGINFVTKKIVRGLCEIKLKRKKFINLGNLDAKRDWGYAKEYCELFWKILQLKKPNDIVIATGKNYSVRKFVEIVASKLNFNLYWKGKGYKEVGIDNKTGQILIKVNRRFFRPTDVNNLLGNPKKAIKLLKWKSKTSLNELIKLMIKEEIKLISNERFY